MMNKYFIKTKINSVENPLNHFKSYPNNGLFQPDLHLIVPCLALPSNNCFNLSFTLWSLNDDKIS